MPGRIQIPRETLLTVSLAVLPELQIYLQRPHKFTVNIYARTTNPGRTKVKQLPERLPVHGTPPDSTQAFMLTDSPRQSPT